MALLTLLVIAVTFALCASLVPLTRPLAARGWERSTSRARASTTPAPPRASAASRSSSRSRASWWRATSSLRALDALGLPALAEPLVALREAPRVAGKLRAVLIGAALCFLVGLLDDVLGSRLPVAVKLAGQVAGGGA